MIEKFHKLCFACLLAVYLLIFAGSTVRSTGSGMGCPDWPTCFGRFIPPTSVDQLPDDYKAIYSAYRRNKNIKFAKFLSFVGASTTADRLLHDKSILREADFNVVKTWTEYVNRLLGVLVGLLVIALAVFSFRLRKNNIQLFLLSWIGLLLVIFQGWFGSIVVSTNLTSWTVTVHMFLAALIVILLTFLLSMSASLSCRTVSTAPPSVRWLLGGCALMLLVQFFLGTTVRVAIDTMSLSGIPREIWGKKLGGTFWVHRSFSIVLLALHFVLLYRLKTMKEGKRFSMMLLLLTATAILSGMGMVYFGVPFLLQPLHLTFAMVLVGLQVYLFCRLNFSFSFVKQ